MCLCLYVRIHVYKMVTLGKSNSKSNMHFKCFFNIKVLNNIKSLLIESLIIEQ